MSDCQGPDHVREPFAGTSAPTARPDVKDLLPALKAHLEHERARRRRWHQRLIQVVRLYCRQHQLVARLERQLAELEKG